MFQGINLLDIAATDADVYGARCARFLFSDDELANHFIWEPGTPLRKSDRQPLYCRNRLDLLKSILFQSFYHSSFYPFFLIFKEL